MSHSNVANSCTYHRVSTQIDDALQPEDDEIHGISDGNPWDDPDELLDEGYPIRMKNGPWILVQNSELVGGFNPSEKYEGQLR